MNTLSNKVAIVTGASAGIGYASARLFAREGASVVVGARRQQELDALVREIEAEGGRAVALAGDVGDESYARALVDVATEAYGGLDIAFNNAGVLGAMGPASDMSRAGGQVSATGHGGPGRWLAVIHLVFCGPYCGNAGHGRLRYQQGWPDRTDPGAGG